MVTDAKLKAAAAEAEAHIWASLAAKYPEPHVFSEWFVKKMGKLMRRGNHPVAYRVARSVVAVILAVAILLGTLFAVGPEVRADVIRWFKSAFKEFTSYTNEDPTEGTAEIIKHDYQLSVIPKGYRELTVIDGKESKTYLYANESGHFLQFAYSYGESEKSIFIKTEDYTHTHGTVNGQSADIYLIDNENETNAIVWKDPETEVLLAIYAKIDKDALIEIAETVQIKKS